MATVSPLAVTGFSFLAIGLSCALLRLLFILKSRLLSSAAPTTLPQPVSAGRTSALSLRSPFSLFRYRQKSTIAKPTRSHSRWSPLSAFYRRFTRPSSPLHLSEPDVLPIAMPGSTSTIHSLLDLSVMSNSSHIPVVKNHGPIFQTRQISRSSSMDTLPSYRPLTPVPILVPIARHAPSPPATPSPTTPKSFSGMGDSDIPLVPITPSKPKSIPQMPVTTANACGLPTPPPTGHFPAISLSPFKPNNSTFGQSLNAVAGTRPVSPTHSRFLTSRTLSSLSLSPRSLSLQQSKRSRGLGGVTVKRISPPPFDLDQQESGSEPAQDVANCLTNTGNITFEPKEELIENSTQSVSLAASPPSFLLDFSSPPSSPVSDSSSTLDLLSPSPSPSNSDISPTSVPLTASRTTSQSSNSSDLAKSGPISLVDVDMNVDASGMPGFEVDWRVPEWSFDVEEPGDTELVLADFDSPSSVEESSGSPVQKLTRKQVEEQLIELDDEDTESNEEQKRVGERKWEWDGELDDQGVWDVEAQTEAGISRVDPVLEDEEAVLEGLCEGRDMVDPVVLSSALALAKELDDDYEAETDIKYPDPDLLPLPETINVLPSIFTEADNIPMISICTQPAVLRRNLSNDDSDVSSGSSLPSAASPISLVQTPTPPASPPREAKIPSLPKPTIMDDLDNDRLAPTSAILPMSKCLGPTDMKPMEDRFRASSVPLVGTETNSSPTDGALLSAKVSNRIQDNSHFFEDERFFYSPECITQELDSDDEFTVNVEAASDDDCADDSHYDDEADILPSSDEVDGDCVESAEGKEVVLHCPEDRLQIGQAKNFDCGAGEEKVVTDTLKGIRAHAVINAAEMTLASEMDAHPSDKIPSYAEDEVQEKIAPASVLTPPSEHPLTPVPGTFPDAKLSLKAETIPEPQSLPPKLSVPLQSHRRRRSPLEEAIASTRSPLEVALAMQLRPGLGLGADPAWMVRFMMVMWGWMFGLVLVPTAEA